MKCICPMGGDRTCPDNCLIASWHSLPEDQKTKERRRPLVETLAKQGYSPEAIATQLGVSTMTIYRDFETFNTVLNVKGQGKDTLGRKKSTGRPKGATRQKPSPKMDKVQGVVDDLVKAHKTISRKKLAEEYDVGQKTIQLADQRARGRLEAELAHEEGQREALASVLDAAATKNFSEKGALRIEDAIRIHKERLNRSYWQQVNEEVIRRIAEADDAVRKQNKEMNEKILRLEAMITQRAVFTERQFQQLLMCIHPDNTASVAVRNELLPFINKNRQRLVKDANGAANPHIRSN